MFIDVKNDKEHDNYEGEVHVLNWIQSENSWLSVVKKRDAQFDRYKKTGPNYLWSRYT